MQAYLNLMANVMSTGETVKNRTGVDTRMVPAAMLQFNLQDGFPAMTTKKLFFDAVKGELIGFLRGATSAAEYRALGCNVWNKNANEHGKDVHGNFVENKWLSSPHRIGEDDLGLLGYAHGWRNFGASDHQLGVDQIFSALNDLRNNPESRRILVSAWNPGELHKAALPPCHVLFKLMPNPATKTLHLSYYQRSCDLFLGVPFNIASYALLLELFCVWSGYAPGTLTAHMDDVHIYESHFEQCYEQMSRKPFDPPQLSLEVPEDAETLPLNKLLAELNPSRIKLLGYEHHPAIKAEMMV